MEPLVVELSRRAARLIHFAECEQGYCLVESDNAIAIIAVATGDGEFLWPPTFAEATGRVSTGRPPVLWFNAVMGELMVLKTALCFECLVAHLQHVGHRSQVNESGMGQIQDSTKYPVSVFSN